MTPSFEVSMPNTSFCIFYLDGTDFKKYDAFKCNNHLYTEENLVYAMMACREDDECSMISSNDCDNKTAEYQLCGQAPDIVSTDNDQACTYRKKSISFLSIKSLSLS